MKAGAHNQQTDLSAYGTQTPRLTETCFVLFCFFLEKFFNGAAKTEKAEV